ncbi:box C/D snoRNA protein 1 [Kryptolebias marmoratus]|uniref:Box C/D snoRNA protein 1 n=1 Tax=Kryptolebias marmoratus TaxID=37003 RepID=A0A3Q3ACI3_KRYMA|nr:box C/D snoRNA protein 1 [Kryptolebias marmoratus]
MCSLILPKTKKMSTSESQVDSSCREEEQKARKRKISLSKCGVCGSEEAKYRCPACLKHSCSLLCVKKHKDDTGCSGVRNKTAFVTLSQFDEMALLSDYRFLEDTGRFADSSTRDDMIRAPRTTAKAKKLATHARKMNITLRFLPVTFTRSKENSTFFLTKEKRFLWHLKLIFPQSNTEFSQRRVSDEQTLIQILTAYIHPTDSDPVSRQKLKMYVHYPFNHVKVFMKAEGRKANSVRYHELDIEKSLRDNLSYKTLIEYPVLHVVLRDYWKDYPLKGPAQPVSARTSSATKNVWMDQEEAKVSPQRQGSSSAAGTDVCTPQTEPPLEKRAKRGAGEEEREEGEVIDSSDEEEDQNQDEIVLCSENYDDAKSSFKDMESVDDSGCRHSSRDPSLGESAAGSADPSAEVTMTEPETARSVHCQHGNESANAADSCQME